MTQPKRQHPDPRSIPPLQIVQAPRLVGAVDDGAAVRVSPPLGLRAGLIALGTAAVIATPVILLNDHQGSNGGPAAPPAATLASAGTWSPARSLPSSVLVSAVQPHEVVIAKHAPAKVAPAKVAPAPRGPLDLSTSDLAASVEPGSGAYAPPAYLVPDYRQVAQTYQIPWRVLAAVNYIESGYDTALGARRGQGALRRCVGAVVPHVLEHEVLRARRISPAPSRIRVIFASVDTDCPEAAAFLARHTVKAWPTFFAIHPGPIAWSATGRARGRRGSCAGWSRRAWPRCAAGRRTSNTMMKKNDVLL